MTACAAVVVEEKVASAEGGARLMLLSAGVMIVMWEGFFSSSIPGMLLCVAGTVCNGITMTTIGKVMSKDVHVLLLTLLHSARVINGFGATICVV